MMTPSRSYLIRGLYEWIADNNMTPYLTVSTLIDGVSVPIDFAKDGKIVLNISHAATKELRVGNDAVEFKARFGSKIYHIYVPISAILAIFAKESQKGMVFSAADIENYDAIMNEQNTTEPQPETKAKKPKLKLVKG